MGKSFRSKSASLCLVTICLFFFACRKSSPGPDSSGAPAISPDSQIAVLKGAVSQDPKNVNAWISLGDASMDAGRFQDAIDAYASALKLDPGNVDVRVDMGTCYRNVGNPQQAVAEYKKALDINPHHANAMRNMGVVLAYDLHRGEEAAKMFTEYLKQNPSAPDADGIRQEIAKLKAMDGKKH